MTGPRDPFDDPTASAPSGPPPIPAWWDEGTPRSDGVPAPAPAASLQPGGPTNRPRLVVGLTVAACLLVGGGIAVWQASRADTPNAASATPHLSSPMPSSTTTSTQPSATTAQSPQGPATSVLTALDAAATLQIKGRAPVNDYNRDAFGQEWLDVDRNGCDTRNDILRRDLVDVVLKPDTNGCTVLSGTLHDPYSGQTVAFVRGAETSSAVQIDHVVALADSWQKGAREWSDERRAQFANDPLNLLAVDGSLNQQKIAGDAATWLPPNRAYRCEYAARIVAVKVKYELWVTQAESDALLRILGACPNEPVTIGA